MTEELNKIKKYSLGKIVKLFVLICLVLLISPFVLNYTLRHVVGPSLELFYDKEMKYNTQCGQASPMRIAVPVLEKSEVFSCEFRANSTHSYEVSLQYPYETREERIKIWDMLGGTVFTNKDGVFVTSVPGTISYSIFENGKKITGKEGIFPKIISHGSNYLNAGLLILRMNRDSVYRIEISGIPKKNYIYHGIYLSVTGRNY